MNILRRTRSGLIILVICMTSAVRAGPLDRNDTGPRYNPSTVNMLRVPGVVGLDYRTALATLQQAGLNPRLHFIRDRQKRYRGRAGEVIKQLPVSGGVAMLGASVSLQVYAPGNQGTQPPADQTPTPPQPDYGQPPDGYPLANDEGAPAIGYGAAAGGQGAPANTGQSDAGNRQAAPAWPSGGNGTGRQSTGQTSPDTSAGNPNPDPLWQPSPPPGSVTSGTIGQPHTSQSGAEFPPP